MKNHPPSPLSKVLIVIETNTSAVGTRRVERNNVNIRVGSRATRRVIL